MDEPITINIGNICNGALIEAFDMKLSEVLKNITDQNTPANAKREIRLVLKLIPQPDRIKINAEFTCEAKLATLRPATSEIYVGRDEAGTLYAVKDDPRQLNIFNAPKAPEIAPIIQFTASK